MKKAFFFLIIIPVLLCTAACGKETATSVEKIEGIAAKAADDTISKITSEKLKAEKEAAKAVRLLITKTSSIGPVTVCENKQNFDLTDYRVRNALNAYRAVWKGETDMLNASGEENQEVLKESLTSIGHNVIEYFAVLDLDDDNLPEVVLPCSTSKNAEAGDADFYCILNYQNYQVYYYLFSNKQFGDVKIDGTFAWTGGICYNGFATLSFVEDKQAGTPFTYDRFTYKDYYEEDPETGEWTGYDLIVNHQNVSEAEYDAAWKAEDNKPDVTWHELTEENIIKVSSAPVTDGSIPEPPITTAATSLPFMVGSPVVDKQVFDKTDRNVIEALDAYHAVLADNVSFICFSDYSSPAINENVKNLTQLIDRIAPRKFRRFAIIDLDNDNLPEIVLSNGEYEDDFFIFKYHAGHVFVYNRVIKSFHQLKIDGTFSYTGGSGSFLFESGITSEYDMLEIDRDDNTFYYHVNSEPVTEAEYLEADAYQGSKPDAVWYEFTNENIEKFTTQLSGK